MLYSFTGGSDGAYPEASLLRDSKGNLYGTAEAGGNFSSPCLQPDGCGVVFEVTPGGKERVLYAFTGGSDGYEPASNLLKDTAGSLYGTTPFGGITTSCVGYGGGGFNGCGVVFEISKAGIETVLYSFTGGSDGAGPVSGLIRDSGGNLYGTTNAGGDVTECSGFGCGVVYKLSPAGNETVLYAFTGGSDGWDPDAALIMDPAGNLYGTTPNGGDFSCGLGYGCGVVFELPSGGGETVLYTFTEPNGEYPDGPLVRDPLGNLYGTASEGGADGAGVVFKLSASGKQTVLSSFTGGDGAVPPGGLLAQGGFLYGTTTEGGPYSGSYGVVFKIAP